MTIRSVSHLLLAVACAWTAACGSAGPAPSSLAVSPSITAMAPSGDVRDFDFLAGAWTVKNRRLKQRGVGSNEWEEFPATICATIYLGGVANVDEIRFPTKGWAGVTLRTFRVKERRWAIYWVNSRLGEVFPPVVGGFQGDEGTFYGEDEDDGRPVTVRFRWTRQGPDRAHWEQSFSYDGRTWEVNWMNDLERADPSICGTART